MGLKEDADFARYLSMGAIATDAVRRDLTRHGHEAIELERYAMANKVWQTKVKRLRLPDLVCVRCGLRIESRGKTQLGVVLSHSDAQGRAWDEGGMRVGDLYAFLRVDPDRTPPHASEAVYFRTNDLRIAVKLAKESNRKAISEGSELTLSWTCWVPGQSGTFIGIDTADRLVCQWDNGRRYRYSNWRRWQVRHLYMAPGDTITANETMVAGIVGPVGDISCPAGWDLEASVADLDPAERYAAVKVAGITGTTVLRAQLVDIAENEPDWRLRLEAMARLARLEPSNWTSPIADTALSPANPGEQRIESVFILSEIPTDEAAEALAEVALPDNEKPSELRAAAVWGLGTGVHPRADLVLPSVADQDDLVALHAIAGLPALTDAMTATLADWLDQDDRHAAAAVHILRRHQAVRTLLQAVHAGGRRRLWALRALGDLPRELVETLGADLVTPDVEADLEPIWIGHADWLRTEAAGDLEALDVQKIRFSPLV
jgi:hypothetical protein